MEIEEVDINEAGHASGLYNQIAEPVPFSFPVDDDQFRMGIVWDGGDHGLHRYLRDQRVLHCRAGSSIVGFTHIAVEHRDEARRGVIRFIGFLPGDRRVGQMLLDEAERQLRSADVDVIMAFARDYGYPFHLKATGDLSYSLSHIVGLLGSNGYSLPPHHRYTLSQEIHFDWPSLNVTRPELPDERLVVQIARDESISDLPKLMFHLELEGQKVGESETWPVGRWTTAHGAREMFAMSIDIGDQWQGRGWGRYLLTRGLWEMQQLGYDRAVLGTNPENYPAVSMYANMGFTIDGMSCTMVKRFV